MTGNEIRKARQELGFTQVELAERLGVTSNTVARWERDEITPESPQMLRLALRGLQLEVKPTARQDIERLQQNTFRNITRARKSLQRD